MVVEVTQFDRAAKNLVVSRRHILEREKEEARIKLIAELAEGQVRKGIVRSVMDFGAFVDLGGVDGLLHVSEMSHRRGRHPNEFVKVGDLVEVKIIKLDKASGKMSLSLKQAMADPWTGVENRYATGTQLTGRVVRVESFGAFIEVEEGIEGLLPVSEMSWQRIRHPADVVKEGDTIKLVTIGVDPVARKMTFSLKQAGPDPWATAVDKYPVHSVVTGTVTRVVDFGAFVELEPGLEGLIHISELAPTRIRAASDVAKPGQEVKVRVMEVQQGSPAGFAVAEMRDRAGCSRVRRSRGAGGAAGRRRKNARSCAADWIGIGNGMESLFLCGISGQAYFLLEIGLRVRYQVGWATAHRFPCGGASLMGEYAHPTS